MMYSLRNEETNRINTLSLDTNTKGKEGGETNRLQPEKGAAEIQKKDHTQSNTTVGGTGVTYLRRTQL